jgi:hypothetical protein
MNWLTEITKTVRAPDKTARTNLVGRFVDNIVNKGLEYFYTIGMSATITPTCSKSKINNQERVERLFFEFQKSRGLPEAWPENGLTIDDCVAFMQLMAKSGKGLIESRITKQYFSKNVRTFGDHVRYYLGLCFLYRAFTRD